MNKVSIDRVQTDTREVNQLQNNLIKSLTQVGNDLSQVSLLGEVKGAVLSLSQVQQQLGPGWVPCDGRRIVGSALNQLTGALVAPTVTPASGVSYFVRIN